jgi:hypothetical protein
MARDIFNEGCGWDWCKETNDSAAASSSKFTIDYVELEGFEGADDSPSASGSPASAPSTPSLVPNSTLPAAPTTSSEHGGLRAPIFASPLEGDEDRIDTAHDDTPLRYRIDTTHDDILGDQAVISGSVQRNIDAELHLMGISLCTWSLWGWFFSASWTTFRAVRTAASWLFC